jgi:CRP/FNR family cyclic AMP-dependent transcriptional regulator
MELNMELAPSKVRRNAAIWLPLASELEVFFRKYPIKFYEKGRIFLFPSEKPSSVYYVEEGYVRVFDINKQGNEIVVNVFSPRSLFPMSKALNKTHNHYFYQASTLVKTREAPPEDLVEFLKLNPDITIDLLSKSYLNAQTMRRRMAHLMGGSAYNRLIYELIMQAYHFGAKISDNSFVISLSESEIGARSGLSRETVSREMRELKTEKLISVTQGTIILHDVKALESELGTNL